MRRISVVLTLAALIFVALLTTCVLIAVVGTLVYAYGETDTTVTAATASMSDRMNAEASRIAGRPVRLGAGEPLPAGDDNVLSFRDESTGDEFSINTKTGRVVSWSTAGPGVVTGRTIGQARAEETAEAVMRRLAPDLGRSRSKRGVVQHRSSRRTDDVRDQYMITFDEYIGGIRTQNAVSVVVNASDGRILSAAARLTELRVSLEPTISAEKAVKVAEAAAHMPIHTDHYTELRVIETINTPQALVWWVELATGDAEFGGVRTVFVDAHSGEALQMMIGGEQLKR